MENCSKAVVMHLKSGDSDFYADVSIIQRQMQMLQALLFLLRNIFFSLCYQSKYFPVDNASSGPGTKRCDSLSSDGFCHFIDTEIL